MIEARYKNGIVYTCHEWDKLDLTAMPLNDDLWSLRADPFNLHFVAHGKPIAQYLRRGFEFAISAAMTTPDGENVPGQDLWCYILETDLFKIFVFSNGSMATLKDWDPNSVWFKKPEKPLKPTDGNGGRKVAKK